MKVEYDRTACSGWFQCVQEWNDFEMNMAEGKADLAGSEQANGVFVREVPDGKEEEAKAAAESCPVDAIVLYQDDEQIHPE